MKKLTVAAEKKRFYQTPMIIAYDKRIPEELWVKQRLELIAAAAECFEALRPHLIKPFEIKIRINPRG